jgi:cap1 methyltransferase
LHILASDIVILDTSSSVPKQLAFGERLLQKQGYVKGTGLGKKADGMLEPLQAAAQLGRRGLGFSLPNFEARKVEYREETIVLEEEIHWCPSISNEVKSMCPSSEELKSWIGTGSRLNHETGSDATLVEVAVCCHKSTVEQVVTTKSSFDGLDQKEFYIARNKANPFEAIKKAIFQNRAALKTANVDKVSKWALSRPECLDESDVLFFGDVCAGPGGFTEYMYWRRGPDGAKGFGFTLKGDNVFMLWMCHPAVPF